MRILFLSFYYEPDLSAGSFRATALIRALQPMLPAGSKIDVLTTMPNRYSSFSANAEERVEGADISIHRIRLPQHKSGMRDQTKAFMLYAKGVRAYLNHRERYDLVFATSSRLMTAVLGAYVARKQNASLYLDVRDIFVDTIKDILPSWVAKPMSWLFGFAESYAMNQAKSINLVSKGFEGYFSKRYPKKRLVFFPNGIDDEFISVQPNALPPSLYIQPYSVLYAGNIGEGQGLHNIIPKLAVSLKGVANFTIIGDGGRKDHLKKALVESGVDNVVLKDPVDRNVLIRSYLEADVLFLHLNDYEAFRKVLPSKIFEYAATGKPIFAGVAGYAAEFIGAEVENSSIFTPCDIAEAVDAFFALKFETNPRRQFIDKFKRRNIMQALALDIVTMCSRVH